MYMAQKGVCEEISSIIEESCKRCMRGQFSIPIAEYAGTAF